MLEAGAGGLSGWRAALRPDPRRLALWTPVAFGLGAQIYFLSPAEPPPAAGWLALGLAAALAAAFWRRGAGARAAALGLALALVGFGAAALRTQAVAAPVLAVEHEAAVEGAILRIDQSQAGLPRLTIGDLRVYGLSAAETPARLRVALRSARFAEGLAPGDRVSVLARLGPPGGAAEPGGFDFRRAAWFDGLGAIGVARGPVAVIAKAGAGGLDGLRHAIGEGLRARLPGETGAFAAALTVGDRRGLPPDALAALRDANLAHVLSISGLHMSLVCGLVFVAVRLGLLVALLPAGGLALRLPLKKLAALAAIGAGALYFGLSGGDVPTERSFVMVAVALAAVLADRPAITLRALALAALLVLARAPESLLDAGFQMSFAATLALVAMLDAARGTGWLARPSGLGRRAVAWIAGTAAASLVAGLATAPFGAFHFERASLYGLPANLAATPALGLVVAPALIGAGLAAPFGAEGPFLAAAGAGIDWMMTVARTVAALPGAAFPVAAAPPAALWFVVAGGLSLCLGRGRLFSGGGAALLGAAAILWAVGAPRPEILVSAGGGAVGVRTDAGLAVSALGPARYAVDTWLRRDGDRATAEEALARPAFAREGDWRVAQSAGGVRVALHGGRRPDGAGARRFCLGGGVVVTPGFDWAQDGRSGAALSGDGDVTGAHGDEASLPCLALDRNAFARLGAVAVFAAASGAPASAAPSPAARPALVVRATGGGARPWSARPAAQR